MKKIILIITILIFLFAVTQIKGKNEELGISEIDCVQTFTSAGIYDETIGIYRVECTAEVSPEYTCKKWIYDFVNNTKECLR